MTSHPLDIWISPSGAAYIPVGNNTIAIAIPGLQPEILHDGRTPADGNQYLSNENSGIFLICRIPSGNLFQIIIIPILIGI